MYKPREVDFVSINSRLYAMSVKNLSELAVFARLSYKYSHKTIHFKSGVVNYKELSNSIKISETLLRKSIKWMMSMNLINQVNGTLVLTPNSVINKSMGNTKELRVYHLDNHANSKKNLKIIPVLSNGYRSKNKRDRAIHLNTEKEANENSRGEFIETFTPNISNKKNCELLGVKSNTTSNKYKEYINKHTKVEFYRRYEYLCNVTSMLEYFYKKEIGEIPNNAKCISGVVFVDLSNGICKKGEHKTETFFDVVLKKLNGNRKSEVVLNDKITTMYYVR